MTPVRIIRFARVDPSTAVTTPGAVPVSQVLLDEQPAAAGRIMRSAQHWEYILADGASSGLTSTESRQDLEHQVVLYYFGTLQPAEPDALATAFKLAM